MEHFTYSSNQIHSVNGQTRENIVVIKNNKGHKIIKTNGSITKKPLTKKEIAMIRKNKFIHGLFNMRPNNKTRRNNSK
jgi:hypothetical protein